VQVAALVDGRQPTQALALKIFDFGRSESAHYRIPCSSDHQKNPHVSAWDDRYIPILRQPNKQD
jgi:hypothetical protein